MHYPALIEFLATEPDGNALAQHLALEGEHLPVRCGAIITTFEQDARSFVIGSFGIDLDVFSLLSPMPLWERLPWTDAVRDGEPLTFATHEDFRNGYPHLEGQPDLVRPTIIWPLTNGMQRIGALCLQFTDGNLNLVVDEFEQTLALCALYLQLRRNVNGAEAHPASEPSDVDRRSELGLTERQQQVLELIADGMTNAQIGKYVGFSESTVKQETMRVFRYLGVTDRRAAVQAAKLRTLLPTG
jgi:DNA-binding CsgD family transcriptional regulator